MKGRNELPVTPVERVEEILPTADLPPGGQPSITSGMMNKLCILQ
jgi:hypothetical protein